jgi:hypothetical protein
MPSQSGALITLGKNYTLALLFNYNNSIIIYKKNNPLCRVSLLRMPSIMEFDGGLLADGLGCMKRNRTAGAIISPSQYGGRGKSLTDKNCKKFENISKC